MENDKTCINCKQIINEENYEYDEGYNRHVNKRFYYCEECSDYATKSINYYENIKRLPKLNGGN